MKFSPYLYVLTLLISSFLLSPMIGHTQRKSEEVLYAEFLDFIKSNTGNEIENEYFTYVRKYGTLEKSFWLYGVRKYKIFCFSTSGNIKDLDVFVYDYDTDQLLTKHTAVHPLGIVDLEVKQNRRIKVVVKLQEHYNSENTRVNVVLSSKKMQEQVPVTDPPKPIEKKNEPVPGLPANNLKALVAELNKTMSWVHIGFSNPRFNFVSLGEVVKSSPSVYFLEVNNKLYLHMSINTSDSCGSHVVTMLPKRTGSTGRNRSSYYVKFDYTLNCGKNTYDGLFVNFASKSNEYSDAMNKLIEEYSTK